MDDLFQRFIQDEYEWILSDDAVQILLEGFDGGITEEEFYENIDMFINRAVNMFCNDEWIIQQLHDNMDDAMIDVLKDYLNEK
jgi:hypothetical protein